MNEQSEVFICLFWLHKPLHVIVRCLGHVVTYLVESHNLGLSINFTVTCKGDAAVVCASLHAVSWDPGQLCNS